MCEFCADEVAAGGFGAVDGVKKCEKGRGEEEIGGREMIVGRMGFALLEGSWRG